MNEEILLRLGYDAAAVKRGTVAMMQGQKQAAVDFVQTWKRAFAEVDREEAARNNRARALRRQREQERKAEHERAMKEAAERAEAEAEAATASSVTAATRSNRARALLRNRASTRTAAWRQGLEAQRRAAGVVAEARNVAGVAVENLRRNVVGGPGGGHGFGGVNSTAMREMVVLAREVSRGNFSRVPGSISILIQSLGKLGTVAAAIVNPITAVVAGLAAAGGTIYKIGYNATQTIRNSTNVGFSTTGYQTFLRQASRESGGAAAAQSVLETLSQNIGDMRSGDLGQMRKFRKYGIATTTANGANLSNEQIFQNALAKFEGTGDPAKRAAMALDIFGESYKKILRTLNEGQGGFSAAMGKGVQTPGQLAVWSHLGGMVGNMASGTWNAIKQASYMPWNAAKSAYVSYAEAANNSVLGSLGGRGGLKLLDRETQRSADLAAEEQRLLASGRIKPISLTQKQMEMLHPELLADLQVAQMSRDDLNNQKQDRGKLGLDDLASMGRRLTGHIRPRQYTVTARMRTAMKIDDLEAAATIAWERGDDSQFQKLRGEADQMRKSNPWLTAMDRDPTRKIEEQLITANKALADIQAMANMVRNDQ